MGWATTIVHLWVVETLPVEILFEVFQRLLLGRGEITEVAREQFRIIGSVNVWMLEFGHVSSDRLSDHYRCDDDVLIACHSTLLIPNCRQEPLDNSLSLPEIQQRYSLIWKMCLVLPAKYFEQVSAQRSNISLTELWPRGRCRARQPNSFSRYGTDGMDYPTGFNNKSGAPRGENSPLLP